MTAPQAPLLTYTPKRTDSPAVFSANFQGFLTELPLVIVGVNEISNFINATAEKFNTDKNSAADARTQALQYSQQASTASQSATAAASSASQILQNINELSLTTDALILANANKVTKRQNMKFFKLNLL